MPKDLKEPDIVKIVNNGVVPRLDDLDWPAITTPASCSDISAPTPRCRSPTSRTSISRRWRSSPSTMSVCPAWTSRSNRCAPMSTARSPRTCSVTSVRRTTRTRKRRRSSRFTRATWKGNRTSKNDGRISAGKTGRPLSAAKRQGRRSTACCEKNRRGGRERFPDDRCAHPDDRRRGDALGRARAAVVVDPNNGNILAMASVPSFDPNTFIPSIKAKDWEALRKDEANPLINRAISAFPPGSTFKLVTALAGLRGIYPPRDSIAAAASATAITFSNAGSARKAAATARSGWLTRSRFRAIRSSINSEMRPGSRRSMKPARCLASAKIPGFK